MKTNIYNTTSKVIYHVDTFLYKVFGFESSLRKRADKSKARRLQVELDRTHSLRDHLNAVHETCYTTRQALELENKL